MQLFKNGDRVEVSSKEPGFIGSYYEGTILDATWSRNAYMIQYKEFLKDDKSGPLIEPTDCSEIRPYPPNVKIELKVGDIVDALASDGWWVGVLVEIRGDEVGYVKFEDYDGMIVGYPMCDIRIHLDWENGQWTVEDVEPDRIKLVEFDDN